MAIQYGRFPGVRARVTGGRPTGAVVGEEQKVVMLGRGDPNDGTASYDEPTKVKTDPETKFGQDTELAFQLNKALSNGAQKDFLYGCMPSEVTVSSELVGGGSGTLANNPIVEEDSTITVYDTVNATTVDWDWAYESPPPSGSVVLINPNTGEVEAPNSNDHEVTYNYLDWQTALDACDRVVDHGETAIYAACTEAESVDLSFESKADTLRSSWKFINNVMIAEPNSTHSDGYPVVDTSAYTDTVDSDHSFMHAPSRLKPLTDENGNVIASPNSIVGGLVGIYAGNSIDDPVIGDEVRNYDSVLYQQLNEAEEDELRAERTIPIFDSNLDGEGDIRIMDNISTSTATDWKRDHHRRLVVDQVLLLGYSIGQVAQNRILTTDEVGYIEDLLNDEIQKFVDAGLLRGQVTQSTDEFSISPSALGEGNEEEQAINRAEVTQTAPDELTISMYITPVGVTKAIDEVITVTDNPTQA